LEKVYALPGVQKENSLHISQGRGHLSRRVRKKGVERRNANLPGSRAQQMRASLRLTKEEGKLLVGQGKADKNRERALLGRRMGRFSPKEKKRRSTMRGREGRPAKIVRWRRRGEENLRTAAASKLRLRRRVREKRGELSAGKKAQEEKMEERS